jgi:hypothetical protein
MTVIQIQGSLQVSRWHGQSWASLACSTDFNVVDFSFIKSTTFSYTDSKIHNDEIFTWKAFYKQVGEKAKLEISDVN